MTKLQKVLVVDASKVIRASLSKCLKGHFAVREETNGELAWETLVLDPSIVAVISGQHLAKLDGLGLVERMRDSKLGRLNRMPLFMLVSDTLADDERLRATQRGVSGFIFKGLATAEMESLVNQLLSQALPLNASLIAAEESDTGQRSNIGLGASFGDLAGLVGEAGDDGGAEATAPGVAFPCRRQVEGRLLELLQAAGAGQPVGVLVFGLDGYEPLIGQHGPEVAEKVAQSFSGLLAKKIRADDGIGQLAPGRVAIIAPQTDRALCRSFAERIRKALAAAQISLHGQRLELTVSVGIATMPEDGVAIAGRDLLALAGSRLDVAMGAGGNLVLCADTVAGPEIRQHEFLARLQELLAASTLETIAPCLGNVGLQIMPILKQIEQAFHFGLPIDDMSQRLWAKARAERLSL